MSTPATQGTGRKNHRRRGGRRQRSRSLTDPVETGDDPSLFPEDGDTDGGPATPLQKQAAGAATRHNRRRRREQRMVARGGNTTDSIGPMDISQVIRGRIGGSALAGTSRDNQRIKTVRTVRFRSRFSNRRMGSSGQRTGGPAGVAVETDDGIAPHSSASAGDFSECPAPLGPRNHVDAACGPDAVAQTPNGNVQLFPFVRWTDGHRSEMVTIHSLIDTKASGLVEADTPCLGPMPGPTETPPPISLGETAKKPSPSLRARLTPFPVEGITTPNSLFALGRRVHPDGDPPPVLSPDLIAREIMNDYNPDKDEFDWYSSTSGIEAFAERIFFLCELATDVWKTMPLLRKASAPAYILGDVHGNFADLSFFLRHLLVLGDISLTPCDLVCLGDYVDRGPHSLECIILLMALAMECPEKVILLRGNHEDRIVCGDIALYGPDGSFLGQCISRMGDRIGRKVFRAVTRTFRYLPLACEIHIPQGKVGKAKILCTHGGFPRFTSANPKLDQDTLGMLELSDFPRFLTLFPNNPLAADDSGSDEELPSFVERAWFAVFDIVWSDPTSTEVEDANVNEHGFACNNRGLNVMSFSAQAVETFLTSYGYSMLFRAHQEKQFGLRISKSSKVVTLFTSSNYLGHGNGAGCAVVSSSGDIRLVMKSHEVPMEKKKDAPFQVPAGAREKKS